MIVKMKKITLMVSAKSRKNALQRLRGLSVMHIKYIQPPQSEGIESILNELDEFQKAVRILDEYNTSNTNKKSDQMSIIVKQILNYIDKKNELLNKLEEKREIKNWFENWGEISNSSIQILKRKGIYIRFYQTDKSFLKRLPDDKLIHVEKEIHGRVYIALITKSENERLDLKEDIFPEIEISTLQSEMKQLEEEIEKIDNNLHDLSVYKKSLIDYIKNLERQLEFNEVLESMGVEEKFTYLQGFCPNEYSTNIKEIADREGWAYIIEDPEDPNDVPTIIRNPRWLRIINPLFKFMGALPGYNEQDISLWFLLSLSLFFAMLIGDAGYGFIFLSISTFLSFKIKKIPKEPLYLMNVLSVATIVWGVVSGNWFGYEKIARLPFINNLTIDKINSFKDSNQIFMMFLCFSIGLVHLSIAHILKIIKIINSIKVLAEFGWIGILVTLYYVSGNLVLSRAIPNFIVPLFILSCFMTLVFANFQKNFLKGIAITLGDLPLSIISSFSDIVSYIRLFAVGSASVAVAISFNEMATGVGFNTIISSFISGVILFVGHSLNIALGLMSVIVHGVRLNMLEFSGHLNMQWAGKEYKPFKE
jgi:V/A-type H+-transporting ATPase subunit I